MSLCKHKNELMWTKSQLMPKSSVNVHLPCFLTEEERFLQFKEQTWDIKSCKTILNLQILDLSMYLCQPTPSHHLFYPNINFKGEVLEIWKTRSCHVFSFHKYWITCPKVDHLHTSIHFFTPPLFITALDLEYLLFWDKETFKSKSNPTL